MKKQWSGKEQPPDLEEIFRRLKKRAKEIFFNKPSNIKTKQSNTSGFVAGFSFLIIFIIWILAGIFIVDPAEQAVILRFGKYVSTVGPGPHWIPRLISTKIVQNMERVSDYSYSAQMLTKDENLVSVSIAVQYRISDLQAYLFNVSDPTESLQQATSSALRQVVGTTSLDQIITEGREAWGNNVFETLVKILDKYKTGIVIVNVSPQPARAPENVQDAFDDAIKAQEDQKRFKEQALAYKAKVVPIAEGNAKRIIAEAEAYAKQIVLRAKGEVAEFLALLPGYLAFPQVTADRMYLTTMQRVLQQSSKVIVDSKAGNLLYLPLDKLSLTPNSPSANLLSANVKASEELDDNLNNVKRRTYRERRD